MKRQPTNREYVLGGLFALMATFPMVTDVGMPSSLEGRVTPDAVERAFHDRKDESTMRRMRWSVMKDCAQREAKGEENVCPDINDEGAMQRYWLPVEEQSAEAEEVIAASMEDLGDYQRNILRRARRNGSCPEALDELLPGFQALCDEAVADGSERQNAIKEAAKQWLGAPRAKGPSDHYERMKDAE